MFAPELSVLCKGGAVFLPILSIDSISSLSFGWNLENSGYYNTILIVLIKIYSTSKDDSRD